MAKNTSTADVRIPWIRAPRGKVAPVSIVLATRVTSMVVLFIAYYVIAFFAAVRLVPTVMGFVKAGSGVTMNMPVETVVAVWIAPSLFLLALLFALVLVVMRKLWRLRRSLVTVVSGWALGREEATVTPIAEASPSGVKRTRTRSAKMTKSA